MGIFFFVITNHVFDLLIHVSINYFLLFMIFMHLLIVNPPSPPKDVRGIFLDISKAFDKVWHEELIYKMKCIGISGMLLKLLQNFPQKRHQPALLNGQCLLFYQRFLYWALCSFYNYINGLTKNISSTNKLFADDTSIFSIVNDIDVSEHELNSDLRKISMWAYQWKMSFNPDVSKQAQEVIFSKRTQKLFHPTVLFNNIPVQRSTVQKHLGVYLDEKLNFNTHITEKIVKASK